MPSGTVRICHVEIRTVSFVRCWECIVGRGRCQEVVGDVPPAGLALVFTSNNKVLKRHFVFCVSSLTLMKAVL